LQDPTKFTQIGIFWFENVPSGNPGLESKRFRACEEAVRRGLRQGRLRVSAEQRQPVDAYALYRRNDQVTSLPKVTNIGLLIFVNYKY
jgi:hypothetical protein